MISTATLPQFAIALCQTLDGVEVFLGVFKYIAEIHCMQSDELIIVCDETDENIQMACFIAGTKSWRRRNVSFFTYTVTKFFLLYLTECYMKCITECRICY